MELMATLRSNERQREHSFQANLGSLAVFIAIISTQFLCLSNVGEHSWSWTQGTVSKFRKRNKISSFLICVLRKMQNLEFSRRSGAKTAILIQMLWTAQTSQKYRLPHLPNVSSPPPPLDEHVLYKGNSARPGVARCKWTIRWYINQHCAGSGGKTDSRPLLHCCSANRSTVKHATWSNSCHLWYPFLRVVWNASLLFLFFRN